MWQILEPDVRAYEGNTWILEHFIKAPDDYRVVEYYFKDAVYSANFGYLSELMRRIALNARAVLDRTRAVTETSFFLDSAFGKPYGSIASLLLMNPVAFRIAARPALMVCTCDLRLVAARPRSTRPVNTWTSDRPDVSTVTPNSVP